MTIFASAQYCKSDGRGNQVPPEIVHSDRDEATYAEIVDGQNRIVITLPRGARMEIELYSGALTNAERVVMLSEALNRIDHVLDDISGKCDSDDDLLLMCRNACEAARKAMV